MNKKIKFNIINIHKLDSTNSYAQRLIEEGNLHEGDVIFTLNQENGRGQGDNLWESEPSSNLLISILLKPKIVDASQQFVLTQLVSVAIVDLITRYVPGELVQIKWPNDIYVNNKKVAGILFQNYIKGNIIEHSIIGIGINVNQKHFYSSAPNPISIINYTNKQINIDELLSKLLTNIGDNYVKLNLKKGFHQLESYYINNLYRYNEWANYSDNKHTFRGKIIDVDNYGRLLIKMKSGRVKKFMFKEVEFVNDEK